MSSEYWGLAMMNSGPHELKNATLFLCVPVVILTAFDFAVVEMLGSEKRNQ